MDFISSNEQVAGVGKHLISAAANYYIYASNFRDKRQIFINTLKMAD
ncbi:MAG: hypothetical protein JRF56_07110 [Deltaproteobacteria bacterium]|nr:hypothetical protein [Deltaproteobacteria bacterium]